MSVTFADLGVPDRLVAALAAQGIERPFEVQALTIPDALPVADAGAVPEVFLTAWDALVLHGGLTPGRVVVAHAGASGVGTVALPLERHV